MIIGGHMYRNTFGIGHTLKEITEGHNTDHPNDPHTGSFGISHKGIYETVNNSLHFQLGLALACLRIIEFFEREYDEEKTRTGGLKFFNKNRQKICATKTLSFAEDEDVNELVYSFVSQGIDRYCEDFSYLKNKEWRLSPSYNIQRYDGEEEGYFSLHNEASGSYPYRMLAWMVYLNDAPSGTEFPYQDTTV